MNPDVIVIGAGPAGSTAAAVAAREGHTVWLLDRGLPPVPHLPESWSGRTLPLLRAIGVASVRPALRPATTVRYLTPSGRFGLQITLSRVEECDEPSLVRLDRRCFDEILVRNAVAQGASFRPLHTVTEVELGADGATIHCATPQGGAELRCRYLIDASGKTALLAGQLGIRQASEPLDPRQAVFTHFTVDRRHRLAESDSMTIVGIPHGYVFVIPLEEDRVSVGVVVGSERAGEYEGDITQLFWTEINEVAYLNDFVAMAEQVLPVIPALNAEFTASSFAGDGYALTGDAAAFTDPFFCAGIDLAVESGAQAGRAAAATLGASDHAGRAAAAEAYELAVRELLESAERNGDYGRLTSGPHVGLFSALADPHLPTVLPIAGVLQRAAETGAASDGGASGAHNRTLVRELRDGFGQAVAEEVA
jgi:flavin-dependent dehydrogenase